MDARTRPVPPPAPAANHIGVVPRWRAWASTAVALVLGVIGGRYGLDAVAATASVGALVGVFGWGLLLEAADRRAGAQFDQIDARHDVARALQEGDH